MKINPVFKALIPPLSTEEYNQLEKNILADGCRDPLVVWNDTLIDGHNRYRICQEHGLPCEYVEATFDSEDEAIDWIIDNQLGRRNLDPTQASVLRGKQYNRTKGTQGGDRKSNRQNDGLVDNADRLAEKHGVSPRTIERDGQFAEAVEALEIESEVFSHEIDLPKRDIVEAARPVIEAVKSGAEPDVVKQLTEEAVSNLRRPHVANNSGDNEWYTPPEFTDAARRVMGTIDLDPASSDVAQQFVNAETYYTAEDDGLSKPWAGNVWLNPPYAKDLIGRFMEKLGDELYGEGGMVRSAVVLVNNATDTQWFHGIADRVTAVCLVKGRISFLDETGEPANKPLQGQMVLYFGSEPEAFASEFQSFGVCLQSF